MSFNFVTPVFGSGATTTTSVPTFSFGTTASNQPKGFGQSGFSFGGATTTPSTGFGFGNQSLTTSASGFGITTNTGFGTGTTGFGSNFGSGFGTTSTVAPSFNFNPPATTTAQSLFSGFGQTQTTSTGGFSGFGNKSFGTGTQFSGFGTGTTSGFGTSTTGGFGTGTTGGFGTGTTGGFGTGNASVFGTNTPTFGTSSFGQGFGQQGQLQQQQQTPPHPNEALLTSVYKCNIFGDERDQIIGNWNLLQAFWGTGKGFYAQNSAPFEYSPQNILCGLKTVGYSVKPKTSSTDALIAISINKKPEEIKNQQIQFESGISSTLGNKPNITVHIDRVTPAPNSKSLVLIYVLEKMPNGTATRRIPNNEICSYLLQPMQKQQLVNLGIDNVYPFMAPNDSQLNEYLENSPHGIDSRLWKQAQLDNPDKEKFIPIPIVGFNGVLWRTKCQEEQMKFHEALLEGISDDIASMQRVQVATNVKLSELKQKTLELEHRVLKLIVKVSRTGTDGVLPFGPEEERMKSRLESLEAYFNKPLGIKDRLSQIITSLRMHDVSNEKRYECDVDDNMISDLKEFLALEQKAIRELKDVLQSDVADMKLMEEEMKKFQLIQSA
ncbi:hypothetical protein PGB90_006636 [Kerria lacca]